MEETCKTKLKINPSEKVDKNDYNHLLLSRLVTSLSSFPPSPFYTLTKISQKMAPVGC